MISDPVADRVIVRGERYVFDDALCAVHFATPRADEIRDRAFCNEVVEAVALVRDNQQRSAFGGENSRDLVQMVDQVRLVFDAVTA